MTQTIDELKHEVKELFWKHHTTQGDDILYTTGDTSTAFVEDLIKLMNQRTQSIVEEVIGQNESTGLPVTQAQEQQCYDKKQRNNLRAEMRLHAYTLLGKDNHDRY